MSVLASALDSSGMIMSVVTVAGTHSPSEHYPLIISNEKRSRRQRNI